MLWPGLDATREPVSNSNANVNAARDRCCQHGRGCRAKTTTAMPTTTLAPTTTTPTPLSVRCLHVGEEGDYSILGVGAGVDKQQCSSILSAFLPLLQKCFALTTENGETGPMNLECRKLGRSAMYVARRYMHRAGAGLGGTGRRRCRCAHACMHACMHVPVCGGRRVRTQC